MKLEIHAAVREPAEIISSSPGLTHPDEVLDSATLSLADKRAILASWASDRNAVPGAPGLRRLPSGAIVPVDTILRALRSLDAPRAPSPGEAGVLWHWPPVNRAKLNTKWRMTVHRRRPFDDDDDPPPCPVISRVPPRLPSTDAVALAAA